MLGLVLVSLLGVALIVNLVDDDDDETVSAEANRTEDGTSASDFIDAGAGDDSVFALAGDDIVFAGEGDDRAFGAGGEDILIGEDGNDFLRGGDQGDLLYGGAGEDTLLGDAGDDLLDGTDIVDAVGLVEAAEQAALTGTFLTDAQLASFVDFDGDPGEADVLSGGAGDDEIFAGNNDIVDTGGGQDAVLLGAWIDGATGPDVSETPVIDRFDPAQDAIVYFYEGATLPVVSWSEEDDGGNLLIDGEVVAQFTNSNFSGLVNETIEFVQI